jgi:hypothetical protein
MQLISKEFKNIEQAEAYLMRLYDLYSEVTCVHIPTNHNGKYVFKVRI